MKAVDEGRYAQIQKNEFGFWRDNPVDFQVLWGHYMPPFAPYLEKQQGVVVDVGSGPVPFFLSGFFQYERGLAVDPLIYEYALLPQYAQLYSGAAAYGGFQMRRSIREVETGFANVVFCLNVLDHVRDPDAFLAELGRICRPGGKLFLFVDVGKPPDHMHPHTIDAVETACELSEWFGCLLSHVGPSWKFEIECLWYVGRRYRSGEIRTHQPAQAE